MAQVLTIAGVDHTLAAPYDKFKIEEAMDTRATATFVFWDEGKAIVVAKRADVVFTDDGETTFAGPVLRRKYFGVTPTGRWVSITCTDDSIKLDETIVGAPAGTFVGPDPQNNYTDTDQNAQTWATDKITIAQWGAYYLPTWDVSSEVDELIPVGYLGVHPLYPAQATLRSALQELAAVAGPFVHFWVRRISGTPTLFWKSIPITTGGVLDPGGSLVGGFPEAPTLSAAPFGISETPDGSTTFATVDGSINVEFDGTTMPQSVYMNGTFGSIYTPTGKTTIKVPIGPSGTDVDLQTGVPPIQTNGQGWYPPATVVGDGGQDNTLRQAVIPSEAATLAERIADGTNAVRYGDREITRASGKVYSGADTGIAAAIFHVGMSLPVHYPSLELDGTAVIVKVSTSFNSGTGKRFHELEFGDAPMGRLTQRRPALAPHLQPLPANQLQVGSQDLSPAPNSGQWFTIPIKDPTGNSVNATTSSKTFILTPLYYRAGVAVATPPMTITPSETSVLVNGCIFVYVAFTADAMKGDVAWVAAFVKNAPG